MGNESSKSSSAVYQKDKLLLVNQSSLDQLNAMILKTTMNSVTNAINSSVGSVQNINVMDFGGKLEISSGSTVKLTQDIKSNVNFKSLTETEAMDNMQQNIAETINSQIARSVSNDILSKLDAEAKSKSQSAFASLSKSSSKSDVKNIVDKKIINNDSKTIKNIIDLSTELNFTKSVVNDCISTMLNKQIMKFQEGAAISGESTLILDQKISSSMVAQCIQRNKFASDITSGLTKFFDIKVKDDTSTKSKTEMKGTASSESKASGFFEDIGEMFKGIGEMFKGIGSLFGLGGGPTAFISSSSCCLCCIIIIAAVLYFKFGGGQEKIKELGDNLKK